MNHIKKGVFIKYVIGIVEKHLHERLPDELPESTMIKEAAKIINEDFRHICYAVKSAVKKVRR